MAHWLFFIAPKSTVSLHFSGLDKFSCGKINVFPSNVGFNSFSPYGAAREMPEVKKMIPAIKNDFFIFTLTKMVSGWP